MTIFAKEKLLELAGYICQLDGHHIGRTQLSFTGPTATESLPKFAIESFA